MVKAQMNCQFHQGFHSVRFWGPILYLLYINDLSDSLQSQVRLFADDTAVYLAEQGQRDSSKLQNDSKAMLLLWLILFINVTNFIGGGYMHISYFLLLCVILHL